MQARRPGGVCQKTLVKTQNPRVWPPQHPQVLLRPGEHGASWLRHDDLAAVPTGREAVTGLRSGPCGVQGRLLQEDGGPARSRPAAPGRQEQRAKQQSHALHSDRQPVSQRLPPG